VGRRFHGLITLMKRKALGTKFLQKSLSSIQPTRVKNTIIFSLCWLKIVDTELIIFHSYRIFPIS